MHIPHEGHKMGSKIFFFLGIKKRIVMLDGYIYQYLQQNKYLNLYLYLDEQKQQKDLNLKYNRKWRKKMLHELVKKGC
jgi:hypothetical protein